MKRRAVEYGEELERHEAFLENNGGSAVKTNEIVCFDLVSTLSNHQNLYLVHHNTPHVTCSQSMGISILSRNNLEPES
jgi:hypothetical protein